MIRKLNISQRSKRGFTLIELVVVLIVLGILTALTIPQFTGVSNEATDKAAQGQAQSAIYSAGPIYNSTTALPTSCSALEAADADWKNFCTSGPSTASDEISVATSADGTVFGVAVLGAGECWMEAWNTDDTTPSLTPTVFAYEGTDVPGFSCTGAFATQVITCPQSGSAPGASWNTPLICDLSDPT